MVITELIEPRFSSFVAVLDGTGENIDTFMYGRVVE
jgi:hypothetical protein